MKRLILTIAAFCVVITAGVALGQYPTAPVMPNCVAIENGGPVTVTADTLWFTKANPRVGVTFTAVTEDWIQPKFIAVGSSGGDLLKEKRRVRHVFMYSAAPFSVEEYYSTGNNTNREGDGIGMTSVFVDTVGITSVGGAATSPNALPVWLLSGSYPDSIIIKAPADTVRVFFGY